MATMVVMVVAVIVVVITGNERSDDGRHSFLGFFCLFKYFIRRLFLVVVVGVCMASIVIR